MYFTTLRSSCRLVLITVLLSVLLVGCSGSLFLQATVPAPVSSTDSFPTSTRILPTSTARIVPTTLSSATATRTPLPTSNPTAAAVAEPSPTPQATSTLLVPTPETGRVYQLTTWTPEKAKQLIASLKIYPETLNQLGYPYDAAFRYEGLSELESALRFTQSDQEKTWRWNGSYNLYQSYNGDITSLYAGLFATALNRKETDLQDFETWFAKTLPYALDTYPISPPRGYQKSLVLHMYNKETSKFSGGFAIWLVQKEGKFYSYPLKNVWENAYFEGYSAVESVDISGDGIAEVIVQNSDWQSFGQHDGDMKIYRLDQVPPVEITFDPPLHDPEIAEWSIDQGRPVPTTTFQIRVNTTSDLPCNTFKVDWQYQLQGDKLKFIRVVPPPLEAMEQDPVCTRRLVSILSSSKYLENSSALGTYKQLLALPFIESDLGMFEPPFKVEKERFSLALYLSNQGDEAGASEQMQRIRASTDPSLAEWRKNAMTYFSVHRDPQALLRFCLTSKKCDTFLSLSKIIALIPPSRFPEVEAILQQMGIQFHASGSYDFDLDGQMEKWLFFLSPYPCGTGTEFWILANDENGIKSRWVANPCLREDEIKGGKVVIEPFASSGGAPKYQVIVDGEESLYTPFLYWPQDQEDPTIYSSQAGKMIDAVQNKLLLGQITPDEAQVQLMAIQKLPIEPSYWMTDFQAQLLYLLGLTQELNGENAHAAQTYLELWQTYPDNPYAIMAFEKLEPVR